jgi:hypothetical protein
MQSPSRLPSWLSTLAPLLLAGCAPATARTFSVADDSALERAVGSARAGDEILLAPGAYSILEVRGRKVSGGTVTIRGKDARLAAVAFLESSGWAIDGITLGGSNVARDRVVLIENSSDIAVRSSLIHGINVNNDPWDDKTVGVGVRTSERIQIIGNRFRDHSLGFTAAISRDVRLEGNSIGFVREGSNWIAVDGAVIRCNRFSHVYPNLLRKEHPDAIQGWWNKEGPNQNLLIEGNVLMLGGPRAVQGIFLAGASKPEEDPVRNRMRNITIRDNIYYGSSRHGITASGAENILVQNNSIVPSPHAQLEEKPVRSEDGRRSGAIPPRIRVVGDNATGRSVGNIATGFGTEPLETADNIVIPTQSEGGKAWKKVFPRPPLGDDPPVADFATRGDAGARPICGNMLPAAIDLPSGLDPSMPEWPGA